MRFITVREIKNRNTNPIIVICLVNGFLLLVCPRIVGMFPSVVFSAVVFASPKKATKNITNNTPDIISNNNVWVAVSRLFQNFIGLPMKNFMSNVSEAATATNGYIAKKVIKVKIFFRFFIYIISPIAVFY
jgi:hypothetical protein